ncbi:MAG: 16S rRNA (adenine(1518)-N(6)/adenine(1519)-N(6))-dimethyltransferase RsmA [Bacilli bacterium]|nr:16S rRNA (adenine(1518)-N(6)/adenine(1519)-N(6))-dimethyltransferase RsmA [Bacilli bacterium]
MQAKKKFGQNFLVNEKYINSIIDAIDVFSNDLIIEIGPGKGALTKRLKEKGANLIAYEIDTDLQPILNALEDEKTQIRYKDFLQADIVNLKKQYQNIYCIGNLPYYITTPIIERIITSRLEPREMVIMVQKEVADRFLAKPHTKEYGYFTVYLQHYFQVERVVDVPNTAFQPAPKVDSTVLKLKWKENQPDIDEEKYIKLLKNSFSQKRKQLKNNLKMYNWEAIKEVLSEYNLAETVRAEELSEEVYIQLCQKI